MRTWLKLYAIAFVVFMAVDLLWLGVIARTFYVDRLGHLMAAQTNWAAAVAFYLFFLAGLVVFVIQPALAASSMKKAAALGAFFGFTTYQTYELTNFALLRDWPVSVVVVDIAWGVVLATIVSTVTTAVALRTR
jgi:uncharacterized membrane protein